MLGKRTAQSSLFDVGNVYDLKLPSGSFHAQLSAVSGQLFKDESFAAFYSATQDAQAFLLLSWRF
jgi:hypothetical protein